MRSLLAVVTSLWAGAVFAQTAPAETIMTCSSHDQKLFIEVHMEANGKFRSMTVNKEGYINVINRDQLITFSASEITFEAGSGPAGTLYLNRNRSQTMTGTYRDDSLAREVSVICGADSSQALF